MTTKTININNDPMHPLNQTKEFIEENLEDFFEIHDADHLKMGDMVRYLIYNNDYSKYIFRYGGIVLTNYSEKIRITGNYHKWIVPKKVISKLDNNEYVTRFFKLESNDDKYEEALLQQEEEIEDKDNIILECKKQIISLKKELKYYKQLLQSNS